MNTDSFKQRQLLFQGGGNPVNTQPKPRTSVTSLNKDLLVAKYNSSTNNNNKNIMQDKSFQKKNTLNPNSILKIASQMENKKKNVNDDTNKRKSSQLDDKIDLNISKEKSSKANLYSSNNAKLNLNISKENTSKQNINISKENSAKPNLNIPKENNLSINLNIEKEKTDIKKENEKKSEIKENDINLIKKEIEKKHERKGSENKEIKKEPEKKDGKKEKGKDNNNKEVKKNIIEEIKKQMEKGKYNKKDNEIKISKKEDKNNENKKENEAKTSKKDDKDKNMENKKDNIINEITKKFEKESKKEGDISLRKESTNTDIKNENKNNNIIKDPNINKEKEKDKDNNIIKNNLFLNKFKSSPNSNGNSNQEKKPEKSKFDKIYEHLYSDENLNDDNKKDSNNNIHLKTLSDLEIDNFKDFNEEDYSVRKYDKSTIDKGKIFFKYRYLKNKYTQINETIQRLSNVNANNINNNNRNTSFNANKFLFSNNINNNNINNQNRNTINIDNKFKLSSNIHLSFFIKNPSSQCLNSIDKDSELRHYHSQFLQLTEKSIISFNLKKFEESYLYLFSNNIIKNLEEFGEFLLVVNGFDKLVIGEFLCSSSIPNDKKVVLRSFINSIKMNNEEIKFLDCFRFFMKRFYLPKDANLILEIMNTFSEIYFEYNKKNTDFVNTFKNPNNIYLLISTLLAVNTMFTRKDIKNLNIIKKEEFVTMNKDIPENVIINIYEQLEKTPLLIDNENYNENIYKRMSTLVKEKISSRKNDDDDTFLSKSSTFNEQISSVGSKKAEEKPKFIINEEDSDEEYDSIFNIDFSAKKVKSSNGMGYRPFIRSSFSLTKNLYSFTKQDQDILSKTQKFYKLVGGGVLHEREFLVYDNLTKLIWGKNVDESKIKGNLHYILITDIFDVFNGIEHSENIKKYIKSNPKEAKEKNNFITIISNKKELNIKSDSLQTALLWYKALKSLVLKTKNENFKKSSKALNEMNTQFKLKLDELWKDFILPKWNIYGNYILIKLKKRNKIQVEKETNNPKKNIDTILKDTENNKNLEYSDFFEFFYLGLPTFCRGTIWKILIGNTCYITETLYENYLSQVEPQNFNTFDIKYHEDINTIFNQEFNINQMISDIIKAKDFFLSELINLNIDQEQIMNESYNILRIFFLIRNDLVYKKSIVPLIFVFLMVEENEYESFCNLYNLICNSDIIRLYIGDEDYINKNVAFFRDLVKKYLPKIHEHFSNLEIEHELYFIPWFSEIFSSSMSYKLLLRVLDLYLINGEYILFQVALTILAVQEDDLLDLAISEIFKILKKLSSKYKEDFFLEKMKSFDCVKEEYNKWKNENELGTQKLQLFKAIFNDDK